MEGPLFMFKSRQPRSLEISPARPFSRQPADERRLGSGAVTRIVLTGFCLTLVMGMLSVADTGSQGTAAGENAAPAEKAALPAGNGEKVYRHVVLFKFKEEATPEQIEAIVAAFSHLRKEIDTIIGFEHGTDVSPEKLAKGFTHCFLVTFRNREDLEAYLPHPSHQAFTKKLKPILADVLVVDYWANS